MYATLICSTDLQGGYAKQICNTYPYSHAIVLSRYATKICKKDVQYRYATHICNTDIGRMVRSLAGFVCGRLCEVMCMYVCVCVRDWVALCVCICASAARVLETSAVATCVATCGLEWTSGPVCQELFFEKKVSQTKVPGKPRGRSKTGFLRNFFLKFSKKSFSKKSSW